MMTDLDSNQRAARIREILAEICMHESLREFPNLLEDLKHFADGISRWMGPVWDSHQCTIDPADADRRGSSIGCYPFTSAIYPWPLENGLPLAPLMQLNLDQICKTTEFDFGSGLLQVWLPSRNCEGEVQLLIRNIPSASLVEELSSIPEDYELKDDLRRYPWKLNLQNPDPEFSAKMSDEEKDFHLKWGRIGFDWSIYNLDLVDQSTDFSSKNVFLPGQIKGWDRKDGSSLPSDCYLIDQGLILYLEVYHQEFANKYGNVLYEKWIDELYRLSSSLTEDYGDLVPWPSWIDYEAHGEFDWLGDGWLPIYEFEGPLTESCDYSDTHQVFFRSGKSGFEYFGIGIRGNYGL